MDALQEGSVIWAKYGTNTFWPATIEKDKETSELWCHFLGEETYEPLSKKIKVCCWGCSKEEKYKNRSRKLSLKSRHLFDRGYQKAARIALCSKYQSSVKSASLLEIDLGIRGNHTTGRTKKQKKGNKRSKSYREQKTPLCKRTTLDDKYGVYVTDSELDHRRKLKKDILMNNNEPITADSSTMSSSVKSKQDDTSQSKSTNFDANSSTFVSESTIDNSPSLSELETVAVEAIGSSNFQSNLAFMDKCSHSLPLHKSSGNIHSVNNTTGIFSDNSNIPNKVVLMNCGNTDFTLKTPSTVDVLSGDSISICTHFKCATNPDNVVQDPDLGNGMNIHNSPVNAELNEASFIENVNPIFSKDVNPILSKDEDCTPATNTFLDSGIVDTALSNVSSTISGIVYDDDVFDTETAVSHNSNDRTESNAQLLKPQMHKENLIACDHWRQHAVLGSPTKECFVASEDTFDVNSNTVNREITSEMKTTEDNCSTPSESEEEDFPPAFTPVKKEPGDYKRGDVVWAKFQKYPFWPAVVFNIRNRKKVFVCFLDELAEQRRILPVSMNHVYPFSCDDEKRNRFEAAGKEYKGSFNFQKSLEKAADFIRKKALGKVTDFFCSDEPEDDETRDSMSDVSEESDSRYGDPRDPPEKKCWHILMNEQDVRELRPQTKIKRHQELLQAIQQQRKTLAGIAKRDIVSERHRIFMTGSTKEKDNLKHKSGFGPIKDEDTQSVVMDMLIKWFKEDYHEVPVNPVSYVADVWLPEAIIRSLSRLKKITIPEAEKLYLLE